MNGFRQKMRKLAAAALAALLLLLGSATPALAETFSAIVTSKSMAVYGEASMSRKLGTLEKNSVVRVTGYSNTIAKISYNGNIGYAKISDMKRVDDVAEKAVLSAAASVYQSPAEDSLSVAVPAGTRLYVLAESGDWAQVERGGVVAYVKASLLERADDDWNAISAVSAAPTDAQSTQENGITVRTYDAVTVESMKVYKAASAKAKALGTLPSGAQVTVLATSGDGWAYIELKGKHGYCQLSGLREGVAEDAAPAPVATAAAARQGVVTAESLPVYQQASKKSALLGTLPQGQSVNVVNWNSEWAYIELGGNYGFCDVSGLSGGDASVTPAPTNTPGTANAKTGTVTAASLAVYQTASAKGKKLGSLKKGQTVNVLKTSEGWAYIELKGNYGFCKLDGLSVSDGNDVPGGYTEANFKATVVTSEARVYASPSTDAENLALKLGSEVQVVAYNGTWACVLQNGSYGFVAAKALSKAEYAAIDGDGTELQTLLKALLSLGYFDAEPSASYNAAAISAIKRFQNACGLEETGVADQAMLRVVYSGYAPASSLLYGSLDNGDEGDAVSRLQARLYALGYLTKTASLDGKYGSATVAAVKLFQNASGITATGTADAATLKALYSTEAAKLPSGTKAADASSGSSSSSSSSTYLNSVPNGLASTTSTYSEGMSNAEKLEYAIYLAQSKLGRPYVYGATGPEKFDCSGLTTWIFKAVGVSLKRTAYNQGYDDSYPKIEGASNLKRGDVVFFNTISDSDLSDHAGVYIGDGYFIHASSGAHKVVVSNLTTGFYGRVFSWGRRILG